MANEQQPDASWAALADLDGDERIAQIRARTEALADLDPASREQQVAAIILAEYGLPDDSLQDFTESRLRAWISSAGDNLERMQTVASAFDRGFERTSGQIAMRRSTMVQTIARERLSPEDIDVLFELIPKQVSNIPRASQEAVERTMQAERREQMEAGRARASAKKPWWKFW